MTIETAYAAFACAVTQALVAGSFVLDDAAVRVDPEAASEPDGDETDIVTFATIEKGVTRPVRQILGRSEQRWVVERECRVELLSAGPARDRRLEIDAGAVAVLARLPTVLPTLDGECERLLLTGVEDEIVPPNGVAKVFTFILRVRSGDPLGASA